MLTNTFSHIPGIGAKTELYLWSAGILDWGSTHKLHKCKISPRMEGLLTATIKESQEQYQQKNPRYFEKLLPAKLHWRFFPDFRAETVFLDIETDGLDPYNGKITTIALYDGQAISYYVNGRNLDDFVADIEKYKVIVSYNGKTFDIPFIQNYFNIRIAHAHIDLRYVLGSLGFKGGLKSCERQLGIDRGALQGMDGFGAVLLWQEFETHGNEKALETLLAYNIEDVVNLEALIVKAYNLNIAGTPFAAGHALPPPCAPKIPVTADPETVQKIKTRLYAFEAFHV